MAIRDHFRRALRKSGSLDSMSQSDASKTASSSTRNSSSSEVSSPMQLIKTFSSSSSSSFRLTKPFTFGSRNKSKDKESNKDSSELPKSKMGRFRSRKNTKTYTHPSQRPLTEQNLQHQQMLSHFTMTFGTSNLSQIEDLDDDGISPCCTRVCSLTRESL